VVTQPAAGIFALQEPAPVPAGGVSLAPVIVTAQADRSAATEGTGAYTGRGVTLGKTEQALKEIPQSVTVLSRQLMDDQQLTGLNELMAKAPGIVLVKDSNAYEAFYARGFRVDNYQIDGAGMSYDASYRPDFDLAIYDRVELLRGAEGLFSAAGEPSGSVNLVRKRPTETWQGSASVSLGSWNDRRVDADVGGPLAFDGRLRGRLVAAYQDREFFYAPSDEKKTVLYGVLETDLSPSTLLRAGVSHERRQGTVWTYGLPAYADGGDLGLPRSRALTPAWAEREQTTQEVFTTLEQRLNPDWTARLSLSRQTFDVDALHFVAAGAVNRASRQFAFADTSFLTVGNEAKTVDLGVSGQFDLWGRQHQIVAGTDWRKSHAKEVRYYSDSDYPVPTLDSDFNGAAFGRPDVLGVSGGWPGYGAEQKGVYGKLQLQATDALRVILGGRYGSYDYTSPTVDYDRSGVLIDSSESRYRDSSIFTPYAGVVYDLTTDWAAYASATDILKPQANYRSGPPEASKPLEAIQGRNFEAGIKGSLLDGKVNTSFALYRIERTGEAAQDLRYPYTPESLGNECCYIAQGKLVSRGLDVELSGELARGWHVFAGYNYNENRNKETREAFHAITPRHMVKVWSTYQLPGSLSAWTLGGGVTAQSRSANQGMDWVYSASSGWSRAPFAIRQGAYALWSASVQYRVNADWSLALNVKNLFDKHHYQTLGTPRGGNWYGEPRSVALTLRGAF
jgi:outer membrane receptor for ferric coprogen and ferric-rhodotorulic acid